MQPKVLIVAENFQYGRMFEAAGWKLVDDIRSADMIQFTGGEDVTPAIYGEERHPHTGFSFERDVYEAGYFAIAERMGIPMSGICRGGQFLNVMSGGRMYQHVSAHATGRNHDLVDVNTGRAISVSSTHHQMMIAGPDSVLVATANLGGFKESVQRIGEDKTGVVRVVDKQDVESVYYPNTQALCFQPHPEFFNPGHECFEYYFELIERHHGLRA
jgi:gamma-glutamyl-gamma-aminobutyrate hydrolase PuuD